MDRDQYMSLVCGKFCQQSQAAAPTGFDTVLFSSLVNVDMSRPRSRPFPLMRAYFRGLGCLAKASNEYEHDLGAGAGSSKLCDSFHKAGIFRHLVAEK
jgi:hypothetical protein